MYSTPAREAARLLGAALSCLFVALIVGSPLVFGAVDPLFYALVIVAAMACACLTVWRLYLSADVSARYLQRAFATCMPFLLLCGFVALQILPLPTGLVSIISPEAQQFHSLYGVVANPELNVATGVANAANALRFTTLSVVPGSTAVSLLKLLACCCAFIAGTCGLLERRRAGLILRSIVLSAFGLSIFAIVQDVTSNGRIYWLWRRGPMDNVFGPYANPVDFCGYALVAFPLSLGMAAKSILGSTPKLSTLKRCVWCICPVVTCAALLLKGVRAVPLCLIIVFVVFALTCVFPTRRGKQRMVLFVILIITAAALAVKSTGLVHRVSTWQTGAWRRIDIWRDAARIVGDFPAVGSGFGTFVNMFPGYRKAMMVESAYWHAFNEPVEILTETGVVGLLLSSLLIGSWLKTVWGDAKREWRSERGILLKCSLASFAGVAVYSLFHSTYRIPANGMLLAIMMGSTVTYGLSAHEGERKQDEK